MAMTSVSSSMDALWIQNVLFSGNKEKIWAVLKAAAQLVPVRCSDKSYLVEIKKKIGLCSGLQLNLSQCGAVITGSLQPYKAHLIEGCSGKKRLLELEI